jgi:hypothetical protein
MSNALIFISYSHDDEEWMRRLKKQLAAAVRANLCEVWTDCEIRKGEDWEPKIEHALQNARVAVFLVSENFLDSEFILNKEVPRLLERREEGKLHIIPVIAGSCLWEVLPWLKKMQVCPEDGNLEKKAPPEWREELTKIAKEILTHMGAAPGSEVKPKPSNRAPTPESSPKTDEMTLQEIEEKAVKDPAFAQRLRELGAKHMTTSQPYQERPIESSTGVSRKRTQDEGEF